jgi:hypothetical protein
MTILVTPGDKKRPFGGRKTLLALLTPYPHALDFELFITVLLC